jgi:diguanylate cyclase (GGDEF)-like protein
VWSRHADSLLLPEADEAVWLRRAAICSYAALRELEPARQRTLIARDTLQLLDATLVRAFEPDDASGVLLAAGAETLIPASAELMERELLTRALAEGRSLISTHPEETHGAFAVHWIGRERPLWVRRVGFYYYWDSVGFAVAAARERSRVQTELGQLRRRAYWDELTGLPNAQALEEELHRHEQTDPFSVLVLDFDGMREANNAFGYSDGGDVLIRAVGQALGRAVRGGEFAARLYTAGDEFAVLLPKVTGEQSRQRAIEIEAMLDQLEVPQTLRRVYRGASVGSASRREGQTAGQVLGAATDAMRARKVARASTTSSS